MAETTRSIERISSSCKFLVQWYKFLERVSTALVRYRLKIRKVSPEGTRKLWRKAFVKQMSFKSVEKADGVTSCVHRCPQLLSQNVQLCSAF